MGEMDMPTEEQMYPTLIKKPHSLLGPADHPVAVQARWVAA